MFSTFVMAGLLGFALGCFFRPPALVVASLLIVVFAIQAVVGGDWSMLAGIGLLGTLQAAYLLGLTVILVWRRLAQGRKAEN